LIAKLICYGIDRDEAIARSLRAFDELVIDGVRTTIPFHRLVLQSDWFAEGKFSTKTVETKLDLKQLGEVGLEKAASAKARERVVTVDVGGKRFEAKIFERLDSSDARTKPEAPDLSARAAHSTAGETIIAPMQGTIVKTLVNEGGSVKAGDAIVVLEAMKMENLIVCHRDGVVQELRVKAGEPVAMNAVVAVITPPKASTQ
jgi:acetyl-CoA/propionyl-CoA/long-chain acyl-CoA carboxylase, biotin carboxylase, biotin carboxyl carrier protein